MLKLIKAFLPALIIVASFLAFSVTPVFADSSICNNPNVAQDIKNASGCGGGTSDKLPSTIQTILNSIIAVTGIIAVIFVVIGGVNYMTSSGDAGKVEKARKTILYALIGLVICVLAFAITNFAIGIINKSDPTAP